MQWEVSTLSTACTFCCSSADQSLYCIAGGVLSRYDESGMSWSHALDHSEYPAEAVATSFSVIPSRPSSSSDLISNEFIVGLHAEAEESCVFVKLNVKERWSRLRHDALARVSLDSVVAIAQQSAPVRPSCCDPLDISSFQRCPLAWASCVIPLVCWSEVGHLHVVAAHPAFGSSFLKLTDVQALHTGENDVHMQHYIVDMMLLLPLLLQVSPV